MSELLPMKVVAATYAPTYSSGPIIFEDGAMRTLYPLYVGHSCSLRVGDRVTAEIGPSKPIGESDVKTVLIEGDITESVPLFRGPREINSIPCQFCPSGKGYGKDQASDEYYGECPAYNPNIPLPSAEIGKIKFIRKFFGKGK